MAIGLAVGHWRSQAHDWAPLRAPSADEPKKEPASAR
jgi:hypothetical protein